MPSISPIFSKSSTPITHGRVRREGKKRPCSSLIRAEQDTDTWLGLLFPVLLAALKWELLLCTFLALLLIYKNCLWNGFELAPKWAHLAAGAIGKSLCVGMRRLEAGLNRCCFLPQPSVPKPWHQGLLSSTHTWKSCNPAHGSTHKAG